MENRLDEAQNRAWKLFLTAHKVILEKIEQDLAAADLPALDWYDLLWTLEQAPDQRLRLHELSNQLLLSRSNITRLADRLEAAGLLYRERCSSDRRGAFAVLTPAGLAMRQKMWKVYAQGIAQYFGDRLSSEEVCGLTQILKRTL